MQYNILDTPIEYLKGVGPQRADVLKKELQIFTYKDLINFYPYKYLDRTKYYKINELNAGLNAEIQIVGKIIRLKTVEQKRGSRLVAVFTDGYGEMELIWFQGQKWMKENLQINQPYVIFGKINHFNGIFSMPHPEMETVEEHKKSLQSALQPVYPSTEKLTKKNISNRSITKMMQQVFIETHHLFKEVFPENLIKELRLLPKNESFFNIHFPKSSELLNRAQFRLKFEELFFIQLQLLSKNVVRKQKIKGCAFEQVGDYFNMFYHEHLPFPLTNAQKRVLKEIRTDMAREAQMNRLLQGDVGAGKTIVGFMSMLLALDNGFQACLMAPTEILANQHFIGIKEMADKISVNVALLTGSTKTKERNQIHEDLLNGSIHILIGTHALLEDKVQFKNL